MAINNKGDKRRVLTTFWDETLCSLVDTYRRFGGRRYLHFQVILRNISKHLLGYNLKIRSRLSSETSVNVCQTTRYNIPEDISI